MCERCGCQNLSVPLKPPTRFKVVAPNEWHVHADGTAHRHAHRHPGEETASATQATDSAVVSSVKE